MGTCSRALIATADKFSIANKSEYEDSEKIRFCCTGIMKERNGVQNIPVIAGNAWKTRANVSEDLAHMDEAVFRKVAPGCENMPITENRRSRANHMAVNKARVYTATRKYPSTKN